MIRVISLRLDPETYSFDESPLLSAQEGVNVIRWDWKLVDNVSSPILVVVMETIPKKPPSNTVKTTPLEKNDDRKGSYREVVPEDRWDLFHLLREWRNSRAKKEGMTPYVILTNMELAIICRDLPMSLTSLGDIRGIGTSKLKKYGSDIIDIISRWSSGKNISSESESMDADPDE